MGIEIHAAGASAMRLASISRSVPISPGRPFLRASTLVSGGVGGAGMAASLRGWRDAKLAAPVQLDLHRGAALIVGGQRGVDSARDLVLAARPQLRELDLHAAAAVGGAQHRVERRTVG